MTWLSGKARGRRTTRPPAGSSAAYDHYIDSETEELPSERIAAYVAVLLERWCDISEDEEDTSPWSTGPLIGEASGPLIYFAMRWRGSSRKGERTRIVWIRVLFISSGDRI
ncbi:hypothetical protein ACFVXE_38630 [Streptomyces sp. NPDC058231]|uniref:hypothetical protein n=1 Tax=Streptomyces sp. NPDC058231 TaxID=3346392 RepID=UPI0036E8F2F7